MNEIADAKKKVLLVDDDRFMIRVLTMKLEQCGFEVFNANNGEKGFETFKQCLPDVVMTDLTMPRMNGWELCKKITEYTEAQPILIIIMSSRIEREERDKIKQFPRAQFADKPLSPKKVVQIVQNHFAQQGDA
jgi:CheY-like chemotaxis protein